MTKPSERAMVEKAVHIIAISIENMRGMNPLPPGYDTMLELTAEVDTATTSIRTVRLTVNRYSSRLVFSKEYHRRGFYKLSGNLSPLVTVEGTK
jgi:hypothetical protein